MIAATGDSAQAQVRVAGPEDAAAVAALFDTSFRAAFGANYPPHELEAFLSGFDTAFYAGCIADPDSLILLGERDGEPGGFCLLGPMAELPVRSARRWWVLRQLYLPEATQGAGLGRALLRAAIAESRRRQMEELYLTVWVNNPRARRLYESHGFAEVGRYAYAVGSTIDDDRILRLELGANG